MNKLAKLSGVSARTLRYYDQIGLLRPARISANSYRIYSQNEVDMLQQILFYRELDFSLEEIKKLLTHPAYDRKESMQNHLHSLLQKKDQIETLIKNVVKTIDSLKGEAIMKDTEKFEGFAQKLVSDNEVKYGKEIREKYGDSAVDSSNAKVLAMGEEAYDHAEALRVEINNMLKMALATGDPSGELAQKTCALHKKWICLFWEEGSYSKDAHKGLAEMYVSDDRFRSYYDKVADGAALFLRDAIYVYCSN